ncbi:hypothetical protein H1P_150031 [Hyella patelloides LEGE 07179]|uniref:Uncharacterized protein n=1 Tax=Hyella patelloides LEGE 07179 TaxID=945734 RepID=A0A563VM81_9CYAN|nr:hypothetical protein H1P_150031 [Hyella patelloides LEGE 07179]
MRSTKSFPGRCKVSFGTLALYVNKSSASLPSNDERSRAASSVATIVLFLNVIVLLLFYCDYYSK